ncbi:small kinetochore-associated protein [Elgaria multicarinata webbii]|uniref:small kinetochore-associated protein n=1 Tax=Elgaria multicarinata webbii TaxID=159646 RepID=UPI002FCCBBC5
MENEKSRIPVYSFQQPKVISVPKDIQLHPKRQGLNKMNDLEPLKELDFTFGANVPLCVPFKETNQRVMKTAKNIVAAPPLKKAVTETVRIPTTRYRREAELRNKNKLLETAKCELSLKLAGMQNDMKDMKEQCDSLEKENQLLKKFQESCMLILETRNCDPVAGENIWEEEEESKKRQTEIMVLSENLNADLELFIQVAKEQRDNLQNAQIKWKQVEEERAHFLEQQQSFHREKEDLFAILDQEEALLNSS